MAYYSTYLEDVLASGTWSNGAEYGSMPVNIARAFMYEMVHDVINYIAVYITYLQDLAKLIQPKPCNPLCILSLTSTECSLPSVTFIIPHMC